MATCFICLNTEEQSDLIRPCHCNMYVHRKCLARWQIQQLGKRDEKFCRLCGARLPNWAWAYRFATDHDALAQYVPMRISACGHTHVLIGKAGEQGLREFEGEARKALGIPPNVDVMFAFNCSSSGSSERTHLVHGLQSYHAAMRHMSALLRSPKHSAGATLMHSQTKCQHRHDKQQKRHRSWTPTIDPDWEPVWTDISWTPEWEPVHSSCPQACQPSDPLDMPCGANISSTLHSDNASIPWPGDSAEFSGPWPDPAAREQQLAQILAKDDYEGASLHVLD